MSLHEDVERCLRNVIHPLAHPPGMIGLCSDSASNKRLTCDACLVAVAGPGLRNIIRHDVRRPVVRRFQDAALTRFTGLYFPWALGRMIAIEFGFFFVKKKNR